MTREDGLDIAHRDELERTGGWLLARRTLGCSSFGMNLVEIAPGEQIPEHDEVARDQEEVFVVLDGDATMVVDGRPHPAPSGTFVCLDPGRRRTVRNEGADTVTVLIASAPRTSGYEPPDWA